MNCKYCKDTELRDKAFITFEQVDDTMFGWVGNILCEDINYDKKYVYVEERNGAGYIRITDTDNACIDSGEKVKINFCPFCGNKFKGEC